METIRQAETRIVAEFDEPLLDVVDGFAKMGWSKPLIAEALEVSAPSLRHYAWKNGIQFVRSPAVHREIKGRPPRRVRHGSRALSITQWAEELGVAPCTIHKRIRTRGRPTR